MGITRLKKGKFYCCYDEVFYVVKNTRYKYTGDVSTIVGFRQVGKDYEVFHKQIDKNNNFSCKEITREQFLGVKEKALQAINKTLSKI